MIGWCNWFKRLADEIGWCNWLTLLLYSIDFNYCLIWLILLIELNAIIYHFFSCSPRSDEMIVATKDGWLHRLRWNGTVDRSLAVNIRCVRFSADLETTAGDNSLSSSAYICHHARSFLLMEQCRGPSSHMTIRLDFCGWNYRELATPLTLSKRLAGGRFKPLIIGPMCKNLTTELSFHPALEILQLCHPPADPLAPFSLHSL